MITHKKGMNINYEWTHNNTYYAENGTTWRENWNARTSNVWKVEIFVDIQNSFSLSVSIAQYIKVIYE